MLTSEIEDLQNKCKLYQEMITNLIASVQALYELLEHKEIVNPEIDGVLFQKSHARNMALMDQMFALYRDQLST